MIIPVCCLAIFACAGLSLTGCATESPEITGMQDYQPASRPPLEIEVPFPPFEDPGPLPKQPEPPQPEPDPLVTEIIFVVDPAEGYRFENGYVTAAYQDDPPKIIIEYGHRELDGANTKWYSQEVILNGKRYAKRGKNSIPFVRGRDNLWWNEDVLELPEPMQTKIELTITDDYRNQSHRFTITKEVRER